MQRIELELDEQTFEQVRQLAKRRQTRLEDWLQQFIKQMVVTLPPTVSTAWELEKEFIRERIAKGPLTGSEQRQWTRAEIYNARFTG